MSGAVRRTTIAVAFALAVSTAGPASAAPTAVSFQCRGSAAGQTADFALGQDVDSSAPSTVAPGGSSPSVSRNGDTISIAVPGPIPGGSDFELPTVTLRLTAGSSGTITSSLYGSG